MATSGWKQIFSESLLSDPDSHHTCVACKNPTNLKIIKILSIFELRIQYVFALVPTFSTLNLDASEPKG